MPVATAKELRAKTLDPLFTDPAVNRALDMMNLDPYLTQDNILLWIKAIGEIESSGGKNTSNKKRVGSKGTTAKGNYQFTDETYRSYLQSYVNASNDIDSFVPAWVTKELKNPDRDPRSLNDNQQRILLMVGTHARAKDADMQQAWGNGDLLGAGKKIFYNAHYGASPDRKTVQVVNREFDEIKNQIITLAPDKLNVDPVKKGMSQRKIKELTDYAATFPNEIDRKKLEEKLQEVRVDAQRVPEQLLSEITVPQRSQKEIPVPYTDYTTAMNQRLAEVTVPQRSQKEIPEADPVDAYLERVVGAMPRIEAELASTQMKAMQPKVPDEITVPQQELKIVPEVDPVNAYLEKVIQPRPAPIVTQPQAVEPEPVRERDPVDAYLERVQSIKDRDRIGLIREVISGTTLQFGDELEALMSDEPYEIAVKRIREEMADYEMRSPRAAFYGEVAGAVPASVGVISGLRALGVTSGAAAGALETGAYGIGSGEDTIDRLEKGAYYGAGGAIVGRVFDSIFDPQLGRQAGSVDELNAQKADLQEVLLQEAKVNRPTAELTNDELATQLMLREIEYLGDVVGRQGADPSDLGSMLTRMRTYAENMGVNMKQLNKVYSSNKEIKELRELINQPFNTLEDLTFLRQDLLDMTTKRLIADTNNTIPQAQSTIVKLRRLASPLATLAEETVGRSFSERIIRGMNRVVRGQTVLDRMWKGMEPFRELAQTNAKFNDSLLDATNSRLSLEFREERLQTAINIAKGKIGKGSEDRLNQFFDDNLEFSKRYRREVTAGDLSRAWMHSNLTTTGKDVSLRSFRKRAEAKAEDAASKNVTRPSMNKWREKNKDPNKDYENIFDSHWRWQRETLTRMELGKQLGFRTAGKPLTAQGKMTLEKTAAKEAGSFKLFDDRIIEEALKREGLSEVQISNAKQIIDDLGINANKGMSHELELVRSLGYVGTIANPYGALMNIHDLFNASFELGVKNVLGALFGKGGITFNPADMGLARQVFGEFVRKARKGTDQKLLGEKVSGNQFLENAAQASESLLEWSMKWSGFTKLDQFGKSRIMGASFRKARQDVANGSFDNKWQYSFSKPEIDQLKRDIAAGNTSSELVRDLVMFDLFRLQPINAAAQTAYGLANPNARIFYMLKGFAIKQFDLMERRIYKEWKSGNKRQALQNAMRYLILSGGGYGIVNEGRQVIKGETPDPEQAAIGALYQIGSVLTFGAMGANDYGYDKFMSDPVNAVISNMMPPVTATFPAAVIEDTADVARALLAGETPNPIPDTSLEALPIIGKTIKGLTDE